MTLRESGGRSTKGYSTDQKITYFTQIIVFRIVFAPHALLSKLLLSVVLRLAHVEQEEIIHYRTRCINIRMEITVFLAKREILFFVVQINPA